MIENRILSRLCPESRALCSYGITEIGGALLGGFALGAGEIGAGATAAGLGAAGLGAAELGAGAGIGALGFGEAAGLGAAGLGAAEAGAGAAAGTSIFDALGSAFGFGSLADTSAAALSGSGALGLSADTAGTALAGLPAEITTGASAGAGAAGATAPAATGIVSAPAAALTSAGGIPVDIASEFGLGATGAPLGSAGAGTGFVGQAIPASAGASGATGGGLLSGLGLSTKDALGLGIAGAGLGYNVLENRKNAAAGASSADAQRAMVSEAQKATAQSDALTSQSRELISSLTSGKLPDNLQAQVDQATKAARANAISRAASMGMSTDPKKNSSLAATLAQIDQQSKVSAASIAAQLAQTGLTEAQIGQSGLNLSSQIYQSLQKIDQQNSKAIGDAIANFAAALGGSKSGGGLNIKLT